MRLFIAEKPSLARSIAAVLPKPQENNKLYIKAGDDVVAWAAGHLLEQAMPDINAGMLMTYLSSPKSGKCSSRKNARTYSTISKNC